MVEELASARHTLSTSALENLEKLNDKLGNVVSEVPPMASDSRKLAATTEVASDSDSDEDPTELFHRDMGTQTSEPSSGDVTPTAEGTGSKDALLEAQHSRLQELSGHLAELIDQAASETYDAEHLMATISDLRTHLDSLNYSSPYYGSATGSANTYFGNSYTYGRQDGSKSEGEDMINEVKNQIRSVKGVFLSARNFPSGNLRSAVR
jgi:hypothetical protein